MTNSKVKRAARYYRRHNRKSKKVYVKKPSFTHPKPEVPAIVIKEEPIYRLPPLTDAEIAQRRARYACGTKFSTLETVTHLDQWMKQYVNKIHILIFMIAT